MVAAAPSVVIPPALAADRAARPKDPTGTADIRARFAAEAARRTLALRRLVVAAVAKRDALALAGAPRPGVLARQEFSAWLREAARREVLGWRAGRRPDVEDAWTTPHVARGYAKGLRDARARARAAGLRERAGDAILSAALGTAAHEARVTIIAGRTYSELEGVTEEMERQIAVELGRAVGEGLSPEEAARRLASRIDTVGRARAELIARTEIIAAHAEAALESYREAGALGVEAMVEWGTAGDDAVCPECEEMEGRVFSLEEAEGMIPLHPNCRCAWLPVV